MTHVARLLCGACRELVGWLDRDDGRLVLVAEVHTATPPDEPATEPDADWFLTASAEDIAAHLAGIRDGKSRPHHQTRRAVDDLDPAGGPLVWDCHHCGRELRATGEDCREIAARVKPGKSYTWTVPAR